MDAGNGMAGHTAPAVLGRLDLDVVPMYYELDGTFPNHEANPIEPANLADLQAKVRETGADIGLAFDGDADRCFLVDERGEIVSPSVLTALIASRELAREPGCDGDPQPDHLARGARSWSPSSAARRCAPGSGHSFIKATMAETDAVFGGEHSGHFYFRDFWRADSGMLAALHVLAALAETDRPLSELLAEYSRYVATGEINSDGGRPGRGRRGDRARRTAAATASRSTTSTGSPSPTPTGGSMSARPTPSRCCASTPRPATRPRSTGCATTCSP